MDTLAHDIRVSIRSLCRSPGFALAAILSLGLGVGLNTVIFSLLNAVLFEPIPVADAAGLVRVGQTIQGSGFFVVSHPEYRAIAELDAFDGVAAQQLNAALLNLGDAPFEVPMEVVSGNYFGLLNVAMVRGRGFSAEEDRVPGSHPVVVIGYRLWHERFGADPEVVGRTVRVSGQPFEVVGVAPEGFRGSFPGFRADIWVPVMMQAEVLPRAGSLQNRTDRFLNLIGRLRPRVDQGQAQAQLDALAARLAAEHPDSNADRGLATASAVGAHPGIAAAAGGFFGFLMVVVGLVLLIATANVANMILARASRRQSEAAVRAALGAGRGRLFRDQLVETSVLAVPGAALGVFVAVWGQGLVGVVRPPAGLPAGLGLDVPIDLTVLAFSASTALLLAIVLALAPSLRAWRAPLRARGGIVAGSRRGGARGALVASQVAVSVFLLVGVGLVLQTLRNSAGLDAGFSSDDVYLASADPSVLGYDPGRARTFWAEMGRRAAVAPAVEGVALGLFAPLGSRADQLPIASAEQADAAVGLQPVNYNVVSEGYFELLRIPLRRGRGFETGDDSSRADVAVVNETLARRYWPSEPAIGKRLRVVDGQTERVVEVVGIVADIKYRRLSEGPTAFLYLPHRQWGRADLALYVRAPRADGLEATLIPRLRAVEPELPVAFGPLRDEMAYSLTVPRIVGLVLGVSSAVGIFLAAMGVFAMVSYAVARSTPEIALRVALGAGDRDVGKLILRQGIRPTMWGLLIGLSAASAGARLLAGLLYGVEPSDPATFAVVTAILLVVSVAACVQPWRRAKLLKPADVLRRD